MIDIEVVIDRIRIPMTFVYGDPVLERRDQVWERLTCFLTTRKRDFNEITGHNEREGGRQRSDSSFLLLSRCEAIVGSCSSHLLGTCYHGLERE